METNKWYGGFTVAELRESIAAAADSGGFDTLFCDEEVVVDIIADLLRELTGE